MKITFATHNAYKLKEVRQMLQAPFDIISLTDMDYHEEIPEPYETIKENSIHKAKTIYEQFKTNVIAEDTGLEVSALDGAPGVYTARYAGEKATAEENMTKLLLELEGKKDRSAQFRTVASLVYKEKYVIFEGILKGHIAYKKEGNQGFGYDPVFIPEGYNQTLAQMGDIEKNKISHRAIAFDKLVHFLKENT